MLVRRNEAKPTSSGSTQRRLVDLFFQTAKNLLEGFEQPDLAVGGNSVDVMIYQP
jgi:hypothetical protein